MLSATSQAALNKFLNDENRFRRERMVPPHIDLSQYHIFDTSRSDHRQDLASRNINISFERQNFILNSSRRP